MIEVTPIGGASDTKARRFDQRTVRIGRHSGNDAVFDARHVSAYHGELTLSGAGVTYRDMGTPNGSYVRRGETLLGVDAERDFELEDGDQLFFGDPDLGTGLSVRIVAPVQDAALAPSIEVLSRLDIGDEAEVQRLSASFDRRVLLALQQHVGRTARSQHLPTLLGSFAQAVFEFCSKATHVSIYLMQDDEAQPSLAFAQSRYAVERETPLSSTVWRAVSQRREAFTFETSDPFFDSADSLKKSAVQIGMCVPLWTGDSLQGLVQVDSRGARHPPFEPRDLEALAVFACQLSVSVEISRLHKELEETVTRLSRAQSVMQPLALRDPVTGLSNRRLFHDRFTRAVQLGRRHQLEVALLYIEVDGFEDVNERHGNDARDSLLKDVAERLRTCLRKVDTLARVGGHEFAAVLYDVAGHVAARRVALTMLDALRAPIRSENGSLSVKASIGITLSPEDGTDVDRLIRNADLAMHQARQQAPGTSRFFNEETNRESSRRLDLEAQLRQALARKQFAQHFQPIVRLSDSRVVAVAALLRWNHPMRGVISPDQDLQVVNDAGLDEAFGQWALTAACEGVNALRGEELHRARVAVRVCAAQLASSGFSDSLQSVLEATGIEASRLELEIPGHALAERPAKLLELLRRLKGLGVWLSVADFGTGHPRLDQLKRAPLDVLKIDPALVRGVTTDVDDARLAAAVIAFAHKMELQTVGEGVETPAQLEFLKENGCDLAQGALLGEPGPADKLEVQR